MSRGIVFRRAFLAPALLALAGAAFAAEPTATVAPYGQLPSGEEVEICTLDNGRGLEARITNYGGIIVALRTPDRDGQSGDVTLGHDSLAGYLESSPYFGALIGRYGNRIGGAQFTLDGKTYKLAANDGPNALHGGLKGFDKIIWKAEHSVDGDEPALRLEHVSPAGDEGYPGRLTVAVVYRLTADNALRIDYEASADAPTPVNLTNHAYFNLKDGGASPVLDHELKLYANFFTPVDETLIPTGELRPVEGTPFDFREPEKIGARIDADNEQIRFGGGYDHNFVVRSPDTGLFPVAEVYEPTTGRLLEVESTEPGVQLYTGNFLDGSIRGKGGVIYEKRSAFCLETQHFPDSPNKGHFPSTILQPGETYRSTTIYRFSTR